MSGIDEMRPECPNCKAKGVDSVTQQKFQYQASNKMLYVGWTTTREELEKYGVAVILQNYDADNDVIIQVRCSHCAAWYVEGPILLKVKKYFWNALQKGAFMSKGEWARFLMSKLPQCGVCGDGPVGHCLCTRTCPTCGELLTECTCGDDDWEDDDYDEDYDEDGEDW
jgi:hypothetical protein